MGRDKAALLLRGRTLAEHQAQKLLALGLRDVLMSGWAAEIPGARFVPDELPALGPLSGIHACLGAAERDAVLFLSVDVPLVPLSTLRALLEAHAGGITLLSADGAAQPLIGVYDRALRAPAEEILRSGSTAVRRLLEAFPPRLVPYAGDPALLRNCNTPEDYAILQTIKTPD